MQPCNVCERGEAGRGFGQRGGICGDLLCPFPASGGVHVLDRGEGYISDLCRLQSVLLLFGGSAEPDGDEGTQDRLDHSREELDQQLSTRFNI